MCASIGFTKTILIGSFCTNFLCAASLNAGTPELGVSTRIGWIFFACWSSCRLSYDFWVILTVHRAYLLVSQNVRRSNTFEYCIFYFKNVYSPFCKIPFVSQGVRRRLEEHSEMEDRPMDDSPAGTYDRSYRKCPSHPYITNVYCGSCNNGHNGGRYNHYWGSLPVRSKGVFIQIVFIRRGKDDGSTFTLFDWWAVNPVRTGLDRATRRHPAVAAVVAVAALVAVAAVAAVAAVVAVAAVAAVALSEIGKCSRWVSRKRVAQ